MPDGGGERRPLITARRRHSWGTAMPGYTQGAACIPTVLVVWSSSAFIVSYIIAVFSGHVEALFPYISDTGAKPPESGIFGFMINVSAFLGAITMCTKYLILEEQNREAHFVSPWFNLLALCVGIVGCVGMGIVASFQELSVPAVHDGGALLAFLCGALYIILQTVICWKSRPRWSTSCIFYTRLILSITTGLAVIPMISCASQISITKIEWNPGEKRHLYLFIGVQKNLRLVGKHLTVPCSPWHIETMKEQDYVYHLVSAVCEWTVAFGFVFYFLTFIKDFQGVTIHISTELHENF